MRRGSLGEREPERDDGVRSDPEGIPVPRPPAFVDDRSRSDLERWTDGFRDRGAAGARSEEHTSELQSHSDLVCRLLLEKKKKKKNAIICRTQAISAF